MRNQFLLGEKEYAILLFVNPDRDMGFFGRIANEEHCPQLTQSTELVEAHLSFRFAPLLKKNLLIEAGHKRMGSLGDLFRTGLPQTRDEI